MEATFKGNPVRLSGELPAKGTKAPAFTLTGQNLNDISLEDLRGKRVVLNIFPVSTLTYARHLCDVSTKRLRNLTTQLCSASPKTYPLPQQDSAPSTALKTYLPPLDSVPASAKITELSSKRVLCADFTHALW